MFNMNLVILDLRSISVDGYFFKLESVGIYFAFDYCSISM
jgi:hypothetical protein